MPRTVEHIVDCHKMAAELRKAGKPIWQSTVKIKHFFENINEGSETYEKDIADAANSIATVFYDKFGKSAFENMDSQFYDMNMALILEEMNDTQEAEEEDFNYWLECIYDWCDYNRIWVD